ncbi:MAG TPA: penicillin-binding transpeptidase domain-containing protein, partial [Vicinamibacteria bacterium]|nr:penicillin-binding transpeptidase domain-containing protein [Vicinamibacteria bacterium]
AGLELDLGQDAAAASRVARDPAAFDARALGREIRAVLAERASGAAAVVRDRVGRRLGTLDAERYLVLEDDIEADLMPEAARVALAAARPSAGVRLGLDLDLSRIAKGALTDARGSVVLLDPRNGNVLAAVSDPLTLRAAGTPAFEDRREPASISKIITTAAALRAGIDPDGLLRRLECKGAERIGHGTLWCSYPGGPLTGLDHAMAISCNIAFAHLGLEVGRAALLEELGRWGFGRDFTSWAPGGHIVQATGDPRQLADLAIGLEATDLTPLHGALMAAVIADGGHMPEPVLIDGESGPLSLVSSALPRAPAREVVDEAAAKVLAHAMVAVAVQGTAAGVAPADFPIAMKTGTGAEWHRGYHANYVGVAPWPNPVVAFSVRVTHEPTSSRVNRTARVVLGRLLEGLQRSLCAPDAPPVAGDVWRWRPAALRGRPSVCS